MQLSKNFTLQELCASDTAKQYNILNWPAEDVIIVELTALCQKVLQPLREHFGPIRLNSGYRCKMLNSLVGSTNPASQHTKGQAADINVGNSRERAEEMVRYMQSTGVDFDQAIVEHDKAGALWLHVSHRADGQNRKNVILKYEK